MIIRKRRIDEAAQSIGICRLTISSQCGFVGTVAGNPIGDAAERAKLALVVQAASQIWS
jgi:5-methyltetrahydropteroyltriglutamate--homocysteine methyltransferase